MPGLPGFGGLHHPAGRPVGLTLRSRGRSFPQGYVPYDVGFPQFMRTGTVKGRTNEDASHYDRVDSEERARGL